MKILNAKDLKQTAVQQLADSRNASQVVLIYTGIVTGLAALVTVVNYILGSQISQAGGLSNLGLRSMLSTIQSVLPMLQSVVIICLELGYLAAMMRVGRGQYVSPQTLRLGFDRFWLLLRTGVLQMLIYMAVGFGVFYVSMQIYLMTPLSRPVMELLMPMASDPELMVTLLEDTVLYGQVVSAMLPFFVMFGVLYAAVCVPLAYSFRMVRYIIVDKPGIRARAALRESRKMMKGNRISLFKVDLSLWWYYLLLVAAMAVCYGDMLLPMAGISLPLPQTVAYFAFFAAYLAMQFAVYYFLRNLVEVTYVQAYDALKPKAPENSVVLGNIFHM